MTSGAARGIDVHCGCFSTTPVESGPEPTPMLFYIGRDAMLLGLALFTAWVRLTLAREQGAEWAGRAGVKPVVSANGIGAR